MAMHAIRDRSAALCFVALAMECAEEALSDVIWVGIVLWMMEYPTCVGARATFFANMNPPSSDAGTSRVAISAINAGVPSVLISCIKDVADNLAVRKRLVILKSRDLFAPSLSI